MANGIAEWGRSHRSCSRFCPPGARLPVVVRRPFASLEKWANPSARRALRADGECPSLPRSGLTGSVPQREVMCPSPSRVSGYSTPPRMCSVSTIPQRAMVPRCVCQPRRPLRSMMSRWRRFIAGRPARPFTHAGLSSHSHPGVGSTDLRAAGDHRAARRSYHQGRCQRHHQYHARPVGRAEWFSVRQGEEPTRRASASARPPHDP